MPYALYGRKLMEHDILKSVIDACFWPIETSTLKLVVKNIAEDDAYKVCSLSIPGVLRASYGLKAHFWVYLHTRVGVTLFVHYQRLWKASIGEQQR